MPAASLSRHMVPLWHTEPPRSPERVYRTVSWVSFADCLMVNALTLKAVQLPTSPRLQHKSCSPRLSQMPATTSCILLPAVVSSTLSSCCWNLLERGEERCA